MKTAPLPVDLSVHALPRAPRHREDVARTKAGERGRAPRPAPACCRERWSSPSERPPADGSDARAGAPSCSRGKLLLGRRARNSRSWSRASCPAPAWGSPAESTQGPRAGWHRLRTGTGSNLLLGFLAETGLLSLGYTHAFRAQSMPEELRAGRPGLALSPRSVLQSHRSLPCSELKAVSDKAAELP